MSSYSTVLWLKCLLVHLKYVYMLNQMFHNVWPQQGLSLSFLLWCYACFYAGFINSLKLLHLMEDNKFNAYIMLNYQILSWLGIRLPNHT